AGLRVLHEHRPADRVHVREVERGDRLGARIPPDLLVAGVAHVQLDLGAGIDLQGGRDGVVPDVVERLWPDLVQRMTVHPKTPLPVTERESTGAGYMCAGRGRRSGSTHVTRAARVASNSALKWRLMRPPSSSPGKRSRNSSKVSAGASARW